MSDYVAGVKGHRPIDKPVNVKEELKLYRSDPLFLFIEKLEGYHKLKVLEDDISMYQNSYLWYHLSLERFLPEMSLAIKWFNGPYWALKAGRKYTDAQRRVADKYNAISRYIHLDFYNCLLYARIVLDRVAALSRLFLRQGNRPSFTSFNEHKKFFKKLPTHYGDNEEYACYIREKTNWFDMPLKEVRDHFIVHASPRHMRSFGYPLGFNELALFINVPPSPQVKTLQSQATTVVISIPRLARENV